MKPFAFFLIIILMLIFLFVGVIGMIWGMNHNNGLVFVGCFLMVCAVFAFAAFLHTQHANR